MYAVDEKEVKGKKRKATNETTKTPKHRKRNEFIDDEAGCDDDNGESDIDEEGKYNFIIIIIIVGLN